MLFRSKADAGIKTIIIFLTNMEISRILALVTAHSNKLANLDAIREK